MTFETGNVIEEKEPKAPRRAYKLDAWRVWKPIQTTPGRWIDGDNEEQARDSLGKRR